MYSIEFELILWKMNMDWILIEIIDHSDLNPALFLSLNQNIC